MENSNNIQWLKTHIGKRLKNLRRQKGLSMEVLTGLIGIDLPNYLYLEKGLKGAPKLETLCKLAEFYGISINYFFQDYKLSGAARLKTNAVEKKMLAVFRQMGASNQHLCIQFLNGVRQEAQRSSD
jgi:transcriptional regulator with XRE-family HTH domain